MAIKTYKPTTPARRGMTTRDFDQITGKKVPKSLRAVKKQNSGRNNQGRITTRHRGGGAKKFYRIVSFELPEGTKATVEEIQYDPNRSANIALVRDQDSKLHFILAGNRMEVGDEIEASNEAPIEQGNRLPMSAIPAGTFVYNV